MKKTFQRVTGFAALFICALSGLAQAQSFTISSAFPSMIGNTNDFTWSVTTLPIPDLNLTLANPSRTFSYGSFQTDAFKIKDDEANDHDSFTSRLLITPPGSTQDGSGQLDITAAANRGFDGSVWIDFLNTPLTVNFGNGGKYQVSFLDSDTLYEDGSLSLKAKIDLLSESKTPVPEPGTMMLLGAGFLGLAIYGKRRRNC